MDDVTIYKNIYLLLVSFSILIAFHILPNSQNRLVFKHLNGLTIFTVLFVTFLIGTVPVFGEGDRTNYQEGFLNAKNVSLETVVQERLFFLYYKFCSFFMDYQTWFVLTAFIYTFNYYYFSKKVTANYFILFLGLITNFIFFSYGTNTIRAGLACSILLLALSKIENRILFYALLISAVGFHNSMLLPVAAILISKQFNATRYYYYFWLICVPLSLILGGQIQLFMSGLVEEKRLVEYLAAEETFYNVGFRIDFLIYSFIPIAVGYYYIYKKRYKDRFYAIVYNTYVLCNAFWILVIRANFSDRFAYLSWFLYMVVLLYPLLHKPLFAFQSRIIALILILNALFTFYMLR